MTTLILSSNTTDFTTYYSTPIKLGLNKEYEVALVNLSTYNSIPNITSKNNIFKYSTDKGQTWKIVKLPQDAYEYIHIQDEIHRQMHDDKEKQITFDICRLKSLIEIKNENYVIDFSCPNSLGPVLGFKNEILNYGVHISPDLVRITDINSILVNTNFICSNYTNKDKYPTLYEFYPKVGPGYKINEKPYERIYHSVSEKYAIDSVRLWLTDQNKHPIDLQGEELTVYLHIREKK